MTAAIETQGLHRWFGDKLAVADLSLNVRRGEVFGLLGPNGAGKSTSIKMLMGLVAPNGGVGSVLDEPLGDVEARARIGFLPEHFRFHDCLNGREFLGMHARLYGMQRQQIKARIETLLARVDLLDAAHRPLREYSKGMLQRIGLAQALLNEPELVFLDEPTSGMDPLGRFMVRDIIDELRQRGTTVVLNSHLLSEVEASCDRVVFIKQGRVVHESSMHADAELEVEMTVDGCDPGLLAALAQFTSAQIERQANKIRLRVPDEEVVAQMARCAIERGHKLYGLSSRRKSLEQLFLEVMGDDQRAG
ncbi:MAG: ABC transporter ATP-binding protein [Steroidobacteraceae bacterium]